jgi:hypothetical protein
MADDTRLLRINPAFFRRPKEGQIIGRILLAFGELEYLFCAAAANANGKNEEVLRALYRLNVTSARLAAADAFLRPACDKHRLKAEYDLTWGALRGCLAIRNRYAHCNWADDAGGLYFADLQASAERSGAFEHYWFHVDLPLLRQQEEYFEYAQDWIDYVAHKLNQRLRRRRLRAHVFAKPKARELPREHNPPLMHVPTWINAKQQALHVERTQAAEEGRQTPTPALKALEAAKAKKLAEKAKRDRRSQQRDPNQRKKRGP